MEYFTVLTEIGAAKIAAATANNTTINLSHIALGDGAGVVVMPDASQSELVNEVFRAALNNLSVDENNDTWIVATGYIPTDEGNFWVREVGIFDSDGDLIAIGNYPETFKPVLANNVAKDLYVKMIMEVSNSDAVTLQIDPSVVLASREFVAAEIETLKWNPIFKDTAYTAKHRDFISIDTKLGSFPITLPENPREMTLIRILDIGGYLSTYPLFFLRNGQTIMGEEEDFRFSSNNRNIKFLFINGTWRILL